MKRVEGSRGVSLIECVSPVKNKWRVRWDIKPIGDKISYIEEEFDHKPTAEELKLVVNEWYNSQIISKIHSGFIYENSVVWLSQENQFNYKAAFDLAIQTEGASLPVTFKFGNDKPQYRQFETVESLKIFYFSAMQHIQQTLEEGWQQKDNFEIDLYMLE